eukprot:scaffold106157_cov60-Phaeocystis_antarctica.AAC.2
MPGPRRRAVWCAASVYSRTANHRPGCSRLLLAPAMPVDVWRAEVFAERQLSGFPHRVGWLVAFKDEGELQEHAD